MPDLSSCVETHFQNRWEEARNRCDDFGACHRIVSGVRTYVALTDWNLTERMGTAPTERDHCNEEGHEHYQGGNIYVLIEPVLSKCLG